MTEREFWLAVRRGLMMIVKDTETRQSIRAAVGLIVKAIEQRYGLAS